MPAFNSPIMRIVKFLSGAQLRRSYATYDQTEGAIRRWCRDHHADAPTARTWFELKLNNPAVYMQAQYNHLRRTGMAPEQAARQVELSSGQALHQASHRTRQGARA